MKIIYRLLVFSILLTFCNELHSQIGVTGYSTYAFGINTNQNKAISGELKTFANRDLDDILLEGDIFFNFNSGKNHRFSIGVGINMGPFLGDDNFNSITTPIQLEFYPLEDYKKLSFLFELSPEIEGRESIFLRNLWGIRYSFGE